MPRIQRGGKSYEKLISDNLQTTTLTSSGNATIGGDLNVSGTLSASGINSIQMNALENIPVDSPAAFFTTTDVLESDATFQARVCHDDDEALAYTLFGNGTSASSITLKLSASAADPGSDLLIQIETDAAGVPSGTPVTNATAAVTFASLTSSLVETTVNFTGSFTLTNNTKYWLVLKRAAFATNATNFYELGTASGVVTSITQPSPLEWNGSAWETASANPGKPYIVFDGMYTAGAFIPTTITKTRLYLGFSSTALSAGDTGTFTREGTVTTTGLNPGSLYLWSSSTFTRQTTVTSAFLGFATSETTLQLRMNDAE